MDSLINDVKKMIKNYCPTHTDVTTWLRSPIKFKIFKLTFGVFLLTFGFTFFICYSKGMNRTQSLNPAHAFAFRYSLYYLMAGAITYGTYRVANYLYSEVADGEKLTANNEYGSAEWFDFLSNEQLTEAKLETCSKDIKITMDNQLLQKDEKKDETTQVTTINEQRLERVKLKREKLLRQHSSKFKGCDINETN